MSEKQLLQKITLLHNPRCSKSRAALDALAAENREVEIVRYLENPLSEQEIRSILQKLQASSPRVMMRTKDDLYQQLDLDQATDDELINAMVKHPQLIERPIAIVGERAAIGRPWDNIAAILY